MEKLKLIILTLLLLLCASNADAYRGSVSVLIQSGASGGTLSGDGMKFSDSSGQASVLTGTFAVQHNDSMLIVADKTFAIPVLVESAQPISWNGISYHGSLNFLNLQSSVSIVNIVDMESYIKGVLRSEMSPSWHIEALKAQAVVARTYAVSAMGKHSGYDLCSSTHCQVYKGMKAETAKINEAVEATAGQILLWNGQPASVFYHTDSGGMVTASSSVWGSSIPYLVPRAEPIPYTGPNTNWQCTIPMTYISDKLAANGISVGAVSMLTPQTRDESGRVLTLEITGTSGKTTVSGHKFRTIIGADKIRSTMFEFSGGIASQPYVSGTAPQVSAGTQKPTATGVKINKASMPKTSEDKLVWLTKNNVFTTRELMEMLSKPDKADYYVKVGMARVEGKTIPLQQPNETGSNDKTSDKTVYAQQITMSNNSATGGSVTFSGRGWGHGVGLSQYGAKTLAENGWPYVNILAHYFPGTVLGE